MVSQDPLGHLAVMDVTEPKENRVVRERPDPGNSWCYRTKGGTRDTGSRRPKGRVRGERQKWKFRIGLALFAHELERMHMEKRGWRRHRRNIR